MAISTAYRTVSRLEGLSVSYHTSKPHKIKMISLIGKRKNHKFIGEFKILYAPTSVVRSHGDRRVPIASRAALHPPVLLLLPRAAGEASRPPRPELRRGGEYRLAASDRHPRRKPKAVRVAHLGRQRTEGDSRHWSVSSKCNLCVFSCFVQFFIWNGIEMDLILFFSCFIANKLTAITDADHYGRLGIPRGTPYDQTSVPSNIQNLLCQVKVAYEKKCEELMSKGLDEEETSKELELLKEPEDIGPTRLVGYFFLAWLILSFALSVTLNR
ncbi:hypothetical protein BHM03_00030277 [Ensete ventricosum]|uniref:Uncharacterized protein n=1 Tax=Ensete ventricosum TaxID=4639 RepID=A0A445MI76_ENSVE|nr:hypothetical protein BHM03_00030277 [Ensete ventricosum]